MKATIMILATCVFAMPTLTVRAQGVWCDLGARDTVRLGCPVTVNEIVPGDSFAVPLYLWNDYSVYGFSLGFQYDNDFVEITSFDLTGGIIDTAAHQFQLFKGVPAGNRALLGWADLAFATPIAPRTADTAELLLTMYVTFLEGATPDTIDLDSTYIDPAGDFILSVDSATGAPPKIVYYAPAYSDCGAQDIVVRAFVCGDADDNGVVSVSDAVYLISYIFAGGPAPDPLERGDVDCDTIVNVSDAVYLIAYIFSGGPPPCDGC
jgi:hypothetical protein